MFRRIIYMGAMVGFVLRHDDLRSNSGRIRSLCGGGDVYVGCVNSYVGTTIGRPLVGVGIPVICLVCVGF